jgi:hypothetical protein
MENSLKTLNDSTDYLSEDDSKSYSALDSSSINSGLFDLNYENDLIGQYELNVAPIAHPEIDLFNAPTSLNQKLQNNFNDGIQVALFDAEKEEEISLRDFDDSNKMELEENTREPETFSKQQKYIDAYRIEAIFDEFILIINDSNNGGFKLFIFDYESFKFENLAYRTTLFTKTNYLKYYRGLMIDLGLEDYMY